MFESSSTPTNERILSDVCGSSTRELCWSAPAFSRSLAGPAGLALRLVMAGFVTSVTRNVREILGRTSSLGFRPRVDGGYHLSLFCDVCSRALVSLTLFIGLAFWLCLLLVEWLRLDCFNLPSSLLHGFAAWHVHILADDLFAQILVQGKEQVTGP